MTRYDLLRLLRSSLLKYIREIFRTGRQEKFSCLCTLNQHALRINYRLMSLWILRNAKIPPNLLYVI